MTIQTDFINEARKFLGVKWVHQGRTESGVDCVGFILLSLSKLGVETKDLQGYPRVPDGKVLQDIMDLQPATYTLKGRPQPGDIILLKIRKHPQHVAVLTKSKTSKNGLGMIHSYNGGEKKVIEHDFVDYWKNKVVSIYRLK